MSAGQEKKAPHTQALIIFDLNTGLRKEELLSLKWSDIDSPNEILMVRAEVAKCHKNRYIELDNTL